MTVMQTSTAGVTPAAKWTIGGSRRPDRKAFERLFALFAGVPGSGKSTLFEDGYDIARFDLDRAGSCHPNPKAETWPTLNDARGNPQVIEWPDMREKIRFLVDLAKQNKPRPKIIAFDTIDRWTQIVCDYMLKAAQKAILENTTSAKDVKMPESFMELGIGAWGRAYDTIYNSVVELLNAGYGVWLSTHIYEDILKNPDGSVQRISLHPTWNDGLEKRFKPLLHLQLAVVRHEGTSVVMEPVLDARTNEPIKLPNGQVKMKAVPTKTTGRRLYFKNGPVFNEGDKARNENALPDFVDLPIQGGYDVFRKAYEDAIATLDSSES